MPHSLGLVTFGAEPASSGGGWADPSHPPLELHSGQLERKKRNTAKLTFWIFENPLGYTYIWAK